MGHFMTRSRDADFLLGQAAKTGGRALFMGPKSRV